MVHDQRLVAFLDEIRHGRLDRRAIVATKAVCQTLGHGAKLLYFSGLIDQAGSVDPALAVVAVAASMLGTALARGVLEAMTDRQYRTWAGRLITTIAACYVAHGTWLLVSP